MMTMFPMIQWPNHHFWDVLNNDLRIANIIMLFMAVVGWSTVLRFRWDEWHPTPWMRWMVISLITVWAVLLINTYDARRAHVDPSFRVGTFFAALAFHVIALIAALHYNKARTDPWRN